jgi:RNA polymerase sigma-70 factor (ECF subfamily)
MKPANQAAGEPTDEVIFARVLAGERGLFELLMRRHNRQLFRTVRGLLANDEEAEDVLQEAYLSMYLHGASFRGEAKLTTWMTRIAINAALARIEKRRAHVDLEVVESDANPESDAALRELTRLLEAAIDALPDAQRTVIVLREIEEMSTSETASMLNLSEEAVRVRLHRARAMLRERLDQTLGEASSQLYKFDGARCDRIVAKVLEALTARSV